MTPPLALTVVLLALGAGAASAQSRVVVSADFVAQPATDSFSIDSQSSVNRETATVTGRYEVGGGFGPSIGATVQAWRSLGVGVSFTSASRATTGTVHGSYPHPFFFNRDRAVDVTLDGRDRTETAVHVSAVFVVPASARIAARVFGGLTFFNVDQPVSPSLDVVETYPYDTIAAAARNDSASVGFTGFHAGVDAGWFFSRHVGIGGVVRVTSGSHDVTSAGAAFTVKAGGVQAGGGLRVRF